MAGSNDNHDWSSVFETTYEVAYRQIASGRPFDIEASYVLKIAANFQVKKCKTYVPENIIIYIGYMVVMT